MSLQILNPDNENKTALYHAIESQSPKSFEIMVQGLCEYTDLCITKMMLKSLALILSSENQQVIDFFNSATFQPPQMAMEQFVPWQEGIEQLVFPCHTSIISQELLIEKIEKHGGVDCSALKKVLQKKAEGE